MSSLDVRLQDKSDEAPHEGPIRRVGQHRMQLAIPCALLGLVGAWLVADYYGFDSDNLRSRAALVLMVPSAAATLGFALSLRVVAARRWATLLVLSIGTLVAGVLISFAVTTLLRGPRKTDLAIINGVATALAFLPVFGALTALGHRVGRARAGSLVDEADARGPWLVVALAIAIAQFPVMGNARVMNWSPDVSLAIGVLSIGVLAVVFLSDLVTAIRIRRAAAGLEHMVERDFSPTEIPENLVDLGLGNEEHVELAPAGSVYRGSARPLRVLRGSVVHALDAMRRIVVRGGVALALGGILMGLVTSAYLEQQRSREREAQRVLSERHTYEQEAAQRAWQRGDLQSSDRGDHRRR
ncbi:MAG: hypothetical protein U0271_47030 [Polyangiaceae bacterium]